MRSENNVYVYEFSDFRMYKSIALRSTLNYTSNMAACDCTSCAAEQGGVSVWAGLVVSLRVRGRRRNDRFRTTSGCSSEHVQSSRHHHHHHRRRRRRQPADRERRGFADHRFSSIPAFPTCTTAHLPRAGDWASIWWKKWGGARSRGKAFLPSAADNNNNDNIY